MLGLAIRSSRISLPSAEKKRSLNLSLFMIASSVSFKAAFGVQKRLCALDRGEDLMLLDISGCLWIWASVFLVDYEQKK